MEAGRWPAIHIHNRIPGALPRAGMIDAFGVEIRQSGQNVQTPFPLPPGKGWGEGKLLPLIESPLSPSRMHRDHEPRDRAERLALSSLGGEGRGEEALSRSGSWRAPFRICACIEDLEPRRDSKPAEAGTPNPR